MDIRAYNREAWNVQVKSGNRWTIPVTPHVIAGTREDCWFFAGCLLRGYRS